VKALMLKILLAGVTIVLLASVGGAGAYSAPVLLPLQFWAARSSRATIERGFWAVLGSLTAAESIWALTYLGVGESSPWIWLLPLLGGVVAAFVIFVFSRPSGSDQHPASAPDTA
jgi:hypothetical protein